MSQYSKLAAKAAHSAIGVEASRRERLRAGAYTRDQVTAKGKAVGVTPKVETGPAMYKRDILGAAPAPDRRVWDRNMAFMDGDGVEAGTARRWDNGCHKARKHRQGDFIPDGVAR